VGLPLWRRLLARRAPLRIVLRQSPDWRATPHDELLDGSRAFCRMVGAATGLTENFISDIVAVWDATFALPYFGVRARMKDIAQDNLAAVAGATRVACDPALPLRGEGLDIFIDDDDWLHPETAALLARHARGADGYVFGNVLCESRIHLRPIEEGCYTNNYAVSRAQLRARGVASLTQHWDAHGVFHSVGFRRGQVPLYLSATNKHPASAMKLKDGLGLEPPDAARLRRLVEAYVEQSATAEVPPPAQWVAPYFERVRAVFAQALGRAPIAANPRTPASGVPLYRASAAEEVVRGAEAYGATLRRLHERLRPQVYLEIGVRHGASLALSHAPLTLGVDPAPEVTHPLAPHAQVVVATSDAFFADTASTLLRAPIELAFIDGMHRFEFALRDFINVERRAARHGVVVFDDVLPNHPTQALRERRSGVWCGDVWKILPCLRKYRPDLALTLLDTHPSGLLLVAGLDPDKRTLSDNYEAILAEFLNPDAPPLDEATLARDGAIAPTSPDWLDALDAQRARVTARA